jgi:hypothetical protein
MRHWTVLLLAACAATAARGQSFPFNDSFASYPPGSTGAPAWSILGGAFNATDGALHGPITLRYNGRPPSRYTVEAMVSVADEPADAAGTVAEAGFVFNMQHDADTHSSDAATLTFRRDAEGKVITTVVTGADTPGYRSLNPPVVAMPDPGRNDIPLRLVVDAGAGRYAVYVGDTLAARSAPAEYAAGLLALRLAGSAVADDVVLRAPTVGELKDLAVRTLFNDPRDIAGDDDGTVLVLHRGSPAIQRLTADGEVVRTFGRRLPSGVPDPVAITRGTGGEVLIVNRFPGEVVVYDHNGGIRSRFGKGRLVEPADVAVRANGAVYVADPGAAKVFVFDPSLQFIGEVAAFDGAPGVPWRIGVDSLDNLVISLDAPARAVVLRPAADGVSMALIRKADTAPADVVVAPDGETWALLDGKVSAWPRGSATATAFSGAVVGGLEPDGRLARSGDRVMALNRRDARVVFLPPGLEDVQPAVTMQNVADTAAIVRWTSADASKTSHVQILRGSTWDTVNGRTEAPETKRQVLLDKLTPGTIYRYKISPTVAAIPPLEWSTEFTFTAGQTTPEPPKEQTP